MKQKPHHFIRESAKLFTPDSKNMLQYKENYKDLKNRAIFATGFYSAFVALQIEEVSSIGPQLNNMISTLKDKMLNFCKRHKKIHSSWIKTDYSKKEILIYIVLDELDFDLEDQIFQELYIDLPVTVDNYYIDPRVTFLNDSTIESTIPANFTKIYSR